MGNLAANPIAYLLAAAVVLSGCRSAQPDGRLTVLAVGQGDCAVFQEDGYTIMIDAGPRTDTFDAGERLILPQLRKMGVREIDLVILSHPDSDHIGGLPAISRKLPIGQIVVADHFRSHPDMVATLDLIRDTPVEYVTGPTEATVGDFKIRLEAPSWKPSMPDNDGSLFVWLGSGKSTAVFTGDAGIDAESRMMRRRSWRAQIAHLGHHGSFTSTSDAWLEHVDPQTAVISCGRNNVYGHPHAQVIDRVESKGIKILRTDRDGTLSLTATADGFR